MEIPQIILAGLAIAAFIGTVAAAYYLRDRTTSNRQLLESNIQAYKDAEKLKDERIKYLEGQNYEQAQTIKNLNKLIKQ